MTLTIDEMATFCKRKGLVYPNSELYGGLAGVFDYGPLGAELKRNLMREWWRFFVQQREDIAGIDGAILAHPKVWVASGHVQNFTDPMLECPKCGEKQRADHFIETATGKSADGLSRKELAAMAKELRCPRCSSPWKELGAFNMMFATHVGPVRDDASVAYLRPETAQLMFADFRLVAENARLKLPFGIAQMGKAFRNEIAPRNFLFRCREFEQMEIEYFIHPKQLMECPYVGEVEKLRMLVYSAEMQKSQRDASEMSLGDAVTQGTIKTPWHAYWLGKTFEWFTALGANAAKFRIRQHLPEELSHYALDTWDLEYAFPFGWKELQGIANRGDYDLKQHMEFSGKDLSLFDEASKERVIPHVVAEPSLGVDRSFLVFLYDAYDDDKKRGNVVLHLHPRLAPVQCAVFPLLSNRPELVEKARTVHLLLREEFSSVFDRAGSIGRRYARQDEQGTPLCVTVDFDSLQNDDVTIRDRDSTEQKRVPVARLAETVRALVRGKPFSGL